MRKQRKTTLWGDWFQAPERLKHIEGVGEGAFTSLPQSVPPGQQGGILRQGKVEKEEKRSASTTGAGLSQGGLVFPGVHYEVIKPKSLRTASWSVALAHGKPQTGPTQTFWGCEIPRMPVSRAAQPTLSDSHSDRVVGCTNHTVSLNLGPFCPNNFSKLQTSSWSFEFVFSKPSILLWRSPTVQLEKITH